ncbi:MAG: hypothetical protein AB1486_29720 [Planctomycetota bacterium]
MMHWLTKTAIALVAAALVPAAHLAAQVRESGGDAKPATAQAEAPQPAKQSDPAALAFLRDRVDQVMYNIVAHGAETAMATIDMKMNNSLMGGEVEFKMTFYWRKDPWELKVALDVPPQLAPFKQLLQGQMNEYAGEALMLPMSRLTRGNVVTMAKDGDLLKLTFEPEKKGQVARTTRWFSQEGRLVRAVNALAHPLGGQIESIMTFELRPVSQGASELLVTGRSEDAPATGVTSTTQVTYGEVSGFTVPVKTTQVSSAGKVQIDQQTKINLDLSAAFGDLLKPAPVESEDSGS